MIDYRNNLIKCIIAFLKMNKEILDVNGFLDIQSFFIRCICNDNKIYLKGVSDKICLIRNDDKQCSIKYALVHSLLNMFFAIGK